VEDRQHFLRIAAHSMRQIPIDYARGRHTQKRDGLARVDLDACQNELISTERTEEFVALDAALDRLAKMDSRQAQIVELRFFAGLSVEETAENLGISEKTVKRDCIALDDATGLGLGLGCGLNSPPIPLGSYTFSGIHAKHR
jgi:RNA polymerase sigma factor (TIGR02999 family)